MVRFNAKIETSVVSEIRRSTAIVPTIAKMPIAIGKAAATTPPKTQTSTTKLRGSASDSISTRSFRVWSVVCQ